MGQLAGNHFATIYEGNEHLAELGQLVRVEGRPGDLLRGTRTADAE